MDGGAVFGLGATLATSAVGTLVAIYLKDWLDERRYDREERREYRQNHMTVDRDTYANRGTVLVRVNLVSFVSRGFWPAGDEDLGRLLQNLDHGNHEHFLDAATEAAWMKFILKSVVLARRRREGELTATELNGFHYLRSVFEDAAKRSFGPLPKSDPVPARSEPATAETEASAA